METWNTIWFSERPEIPGSIGWDARHPRTATKVKFRRNNDGTVFTLFNVHLDHKGMKARKESARLLLEKVREAYVDGAVFLLGDLNSTETDPAYLILTGNNYQARKGENDTLANLQQLNDKCASDYACHDSDESIDLHEDSTADTQESNINDQFLMDAHYELLTRLQSESGTLSGPYGYRDTFTSFGSGDEFKRAPIRIDFIMYLQDHRWLIRTLQTAVLSNQFDDGLYISDHRPVLTKLSW